MTDPKASIADSAFGPVARTVDDVVLTPAHYEVTPDTAARLTKPISLDIADLVVGDGCGDAVAPRDHRLDVPDREPAEGVKRGCSRRSRRYP